MLAPEVGATGVGAENKCKHEWRESGCSDEQKNYNYTGTVYTVHISLPVPAVPGGGGGGIDI